MLVMACRATDLTEIDAQGVVSKRAERIVLMRYAMTPLTFFVGRCSRRAGSQQSIVANRMKVGMTRVAVVGPGGMNSRDRPRRHPSVGPVEAHSRSPPANGRDSSETG